MAYHNICRHQCGVEDVGKLKVTAVKERLFQINPEAEVVVEDTILENVPKIRFDSFIDEQTLIVGCADNREGDLYANQLSAIYNIPMLSIGFWERAFAGEIFFTVPGKMPCYSCMFKRPQNDLPSRPSVNRRFYTHEEDIRNTRFEPGISTDINFITTIGIKLALDLMNQNESDYIPRLLNNLTQYTLVCNTNNPNIGGEEAEIFSYPLQVTRSLKADYMEGCDACKLIASTINR
jgi:molybdopterin/thiamine biosynthesis adenylyltransferase